MDQDQFKRLMDLLGQFWACACGVSRPQPASTATHSNKKRNIEARSEDMA